MSADAGEDEAVLDVKVPTRRRRASDDEAEDVEFHDAAEYAASVAGSQAVDQEEPAEDLRTEDGDEDGDGSNAEGEGRSHYRVARKPGVRGAQDFRILR